MPSSPLIIDCHAHIGEFRGYDLSEETLLEEIDREGVSLALVSNIDGATVSGKTRGLDEGAANRATAHAVRRHPDRLRGLLWGRPGQGSPEALERFVTESLAADEAGRWTRRVFTGLKLHPEMNQFEADAPEVDGYMRFARRHRFPVVIHCDAGVDEASPERIIALAARHPEVPVVLYHMGFGGPHEQTIERTASALEAGEAELYLETAQASVEAVLEALRRVGPRRVLFGTDATYYGKGHYARYHALLAALEGTLSPEELTRVLALNSIQLFALEREHDS